MQEPRVRLKQGRHHPRAGAALAMGIIHPSYRKKTPARVNNRLRGEMRALEGDKSQCQNPKRLWLGLKG